MVAISTGVALAQEMFVTSGSGGKSDKASLSWVVGGGIAQGQNDAAPVLSPDVICKAQVALSLKELSPVIRVNVYPNPVMEFVNVTVDGEELQGGKVFLTDMSGNRIITETLNSNEAKLYVSSLASGIYMVNAVDKFGEYRMSVKVVKK